MSPRSSSDLEAPVSQQAGYAEHRQMEKKSMWQSLRENPKVLFIAFFASFGGFEYGYQQGVLGQSLVMTRFTENFPSVVHSSAATGWLTSVLQLGGIVGSLSAGVFGEIFSRKYTMFAACCWVILGSYLYVGASAGMASLLYAGRFFTGLGVGLFSGVGPLYNAELAAPEMRGLLVSFYQFATILGIMISFWVGYGSNYIGGTGETQSDLAWRLPSIIQGIPAFALACGIWFMPFSPRWLVKVGRDQEAQSTLAWMRKLPVEHDLVQMEYLEIKAEALFEKRAFPNTAEKGILKNQWAQYANCFSTMDNFKRVCTAWLVMFFQQWSGIDAIIYYASNVFVSLGLTGGTIALLATGVTGVVFIVSTVPAMLIIDRVGRKPMLLVGSVVMFLSMVIVGVIVAKFQHDWPSHVAAGWTAVALIWLYIAGFGATWGPVSWTLVSEIFPLSIRAKGASIGASSNWLNNFAIAFFVPPMLKSWQWGTYIFFAVFLLVGIFWVQFYLPETKNASLEEMDRVFNSHTGERDAQLLREAQRDVGLTALLARAEGGNAEEVQACLFRGAEAQSPLFDRSLHIPGSIWGRADDHDADEENDPSRQTTCSHWLLDMSQTQKKIKVTFVSIVNASDIQSDGTGATYSTIRFVDETPATTPSLHESGTVEHEQTPAELRAEPLELLPAPSHATADLPSNAIPTQQARREVSFTALSDSGNDPETGLLRHYCYALAPWIDVGDPSRAFGLEFLILGRRVRPLLAAILALAAGQRSLVVPRNAADDLARSLRFREEAKNGLPLQDNTIQRIGNVFFMLHDFFSSRPSQWKTLVTGHITASGGLGCLAASDGGLNEPSFWVTLRIDLAASIISSEPPQMLVPPPLSTSEPTPIKQVYQHILLLLAHTLSFIFGGPTAYLEGLGPVDTVPRLNPVSQWNYLWTECRRWYQNRPLQVQPVLDVRAAHADEIDPQNASSFPILVYTTPLALVANAVYHVASFLLLTRKPRFAKTLTGPKYLSSSIWHAQSIAGIATSNDTVEQWDPILIAALLLIAKDMTHHLQQSAVLNRLQRITELTGINLGYEIESLQSQWRMSRYEEPIA
ncbi:hypothetical protein CNMCM6936_005350 [Aspergillus lentulus]|nr:hypothetical protein CNMCM6936_005350 [Aspergillus lentulus]